MTTRPLSLRSAVDLYVSEAVSGISVWRNVFDEIAPVKAGELLQQSGLNVVSLVRGGFFPADSDDKRQAAVADNLKALDEAAAIGAPLVVLVCGADPGCSLDESRKQIQTGIEAILPRAQELNIKLGIEPLHPMYADTRSAINTIEQANDICENIAHPLLGVVVDVYHLWWDPFLEREILRCGKNNQLFAFHVCDWKFPVKDILNDRGLMGEGCINIPQIRKWVESAGFNGPIEVEIFSERWWNTDQKNFVKAIKTAYLNYV